MQVRRPGMEDTRLRRPGGAVDIVREPESVG